jgi:hypothetical protein
MAGIGGAAMLAAGFCGAALQIMAGANNQTQSFPCCIILKDFPRARRSAANAFCWQCSELYFP